MASRIKNLTMDQGADFVYVTKIYANTSLTTSINLGSSDWANAQMKESFYHTNATATFNVAVDSTNEHIVMRLASANTAAISPGRYVYDVEFQDASGGDPVDGALSRRIRVLEGIITVTAGVTE